MIRTVVVAQVHKLEPTRLLQCSHVVIVKQYKILGRRQEMKEVRNRYTDQGAGGGRGA